MKCLYLEDLEGYTQEEIKEHLVKEYKADEHEVDKYDILIAYESVGGSSYDSSSWFLLQDKETGNIFESYGSFCSFHGFDGQFYPEETTVEYLKSAKFKLYTGYADSDGVNKQAVSAYIKNL